MQGDLTALIERVENATGPDRELDAAIRDALYEPVKRGAWTPFTSSLDAALALVEEKLPGTFWHVAKGRTRPDEPLFGAELVSPEHGGVNVAVEHESSVALALILALLRALSARDQQDGGGDA